MTGSSPTVRQRELGMGLRNLRNERGMTVEEVAGELLCSVTKISRLETRANCQAVDQWRSCHWSPACRGGHELHLSCRGEGGASSVPSPCTSALTRAYAVPGRGLGWPDDPPPESRKSNVSARRKDLSSQPRSSDQKASALWYELELKKLPQNSEGGGRER